MHIVCILQMRGNQNDDVKIFAHQAYRLGFQGSPNGSILATGEQAAEFLSFDPNCHGPLKRGAQEPILMLIIR